MRIIWQNFAATRMPTDGRYLRRKETAGPGTPTTIREECLFCRENEEKNPPSGNSRRTPGLSSPEKTARWFFAPSPPAFPIKQRLFRDPPKHLRRFAARGNRRGRGHLRAFAKANQEPPGRSAPERFFPYRNPARGGGIPLRPLLADRSNSPSNSLGRS